jgi:hypothetical protein
MKRKQKSKPKKTAVIKGLSKKFICLTQILLHLLFWYYFLGNASATTAKGSFFSGL